MSGTVDVAVKIKMAVGERVAEGVALGGSGVDVASVEVTSGEVDVSGEGEISDVGVMTATAVCEAPAIIVDIIAVPRKLRSCVGTGRPGTHAWVRSKKTDIRMKVDFLMGSPSGR